jgi:hypothetical protein
MTNIDAVMEYVKLCNVTNDNRWNRYSLWGYAEALFRKLNLIRQGE